MHFAAVYHATDKANVTSSLYLTVALKMVGIMLMAFYSPFQMEVKGMSVFNSSWEVFLYAKGTPKR